MLKGSLPEIFLDTDVCYDIISKREPHFEHSIKLLELAAHDRVSLIISESSLANLIYLSFDIYKIDDDAEKLVHFIRASNVVSGGKPVMLHALRSSFKNKEDALQYYTAQHHEADYFITRNIKDYKLNVEFLQVMTPKEFMDSINR
ncbi:PIN domain-containing protein [Rhodohalobacter sp.]|uniref:type II toxin-antitoxin system VapC family toxin n=1 Tax=Rhodohalobacter sp. TaxID=1974210 RepID=UPI002ACDA9D6|nr:PIN domain-containing protein [Rhodohalobacter sp.]MDZ7755787.1 PIN domain-containing protein [Rhodohalobacter sp.]